MGWLERRDGRQAQASRGALLNSRPLYLQLRDLMVSRIADQQWKVGQALPNEVLLSKEFNVSVGTVRKAMDELSTEGLVRRKQGRGTFIADRETAARHGLFDRFRTSDAGFIDWSAPDVAIITGQAEARERDDLRLSASDAGVIRFERIRSVRGRRVGLERSAVPASRFTGYPDLLASCADITPLAQAFGIVVGKAEVKLSVATATGPIAETLRVSGGTPLQKLDRIVYDIDGVPIEACQSWFALSDGYYFCVHTLPT